ncbi:thioredoxin family protein [Novipirellula sp. SH528]|uniref:thioredoxin family protein n=1 Tax=Novipirellula sp. SH528 TaxID=3454466 RepID=UPI003FA0C22C
MLLPAVVVAASGCSGGAGFGFGRTVSYDPVSSDLIGVVQESDVIQQDAIESVNSIAATSAVAPDSHVTTVSATRPTESAATNFVSSKSTHEPTRPALITLPRSGDLDEVLAEANGNVLIDFYADWCGPCRKQAVILHELEQTAAENNTLIVKVNVDEHKQIAKQMQIASLPTLVMVKDGEIVERQSGLARKGDIVRWMQ